MNIEEIKTQIEGLRHEIPGCCWEDEWIEELSYNQAIEDVLRILNQEAK